MGKPLKNKRILITRDEKQMEGMIRKIEHLGGEAISFPTIKITGPQNWSACDEVIIHLDEYHWIIFTSVNGVNYFLRRTAQLGRSRLTPSIACVGDRTASEIRKAGYEAGLIPPEFNAKSLVEAFSNTDIKDKKIVWPTSGRSSNMLKEGLEKKGAYVKKVICYHTEYKDMDELSDAAFDIKNDHFDCVAFFSPSQFQSFIKLMDSDKRSTLKKNKFAIAAIGPATAGAIRSRGFEVNIVADKSVENGMVQALVDYFKNR